MDAKRIVGWLGLCAALLAGCSGSATPQLIGSFPLYPTPTPFVAPGHAYNTVLDVEVADVDVAAQQAARLAYSYGGYLAASQSWYQDARLHTSLALSVPSQQFSALRGSVLALGRLVDERLIREPAPWQVYPPLDSTLTVTFSPAQPLVALPAPPDLVWNPAKTFAQAFVVFARIFTILVDVCIWVSVVVGPFVLMGLGLRWLVQRARIPK